METLWKSPITGTTYAYDHAKRLLIGIAADGKRTTIQAAISYEDALALLENLEA